MYFQVLRELRFNCLNMVSNFEICTTTGETWPFINQIIHHLYIYGYYADQIIIRLIPLFVLSIHRNLAIFITFCDIWLQRYLIKPLSNIFFYLSFNIIWITAWRSTLNNNNCLHLACYLKMNTENGFTSQTNEQILSWFWFFFQFFN